MNVSARPPDARLCPPYALLCSRVFWRRMRKPAVAILLYLATTIAAGAQPLDARLPTCLACHGENGQSQLPEVPSLGAQPALYSLIQLVMFRDKLRLTEPMNSDGERPLRRRAAQGRGSHFKAAARPSPSVTAPMPPAWRRRACWPSRTSATSATRPISGWAERAQACRPARGLSAQGLARLQGQFAARLRCRHVRCRLCASKMRISSSLLISWRGRSKSGRTAIPNFRKQSRNRAIELHELPP